MGTPGETGTCGFCGYGDGRLGDMGDESTQYLHSAVRKGEPGEWTYEPHPGALSTEHRQMIIWCGHCISGLEHKFQRYDDTNLRAEFLSSKLRLELDGIRWVGWEADHGAERDKVKRYLDDTAIHMDKLQIEQRIRDMQNEQFRRAGFDLTTRGWRP